jgi:3-oxoacyl-[acyl-carrier-protein] synthase-3
MSSIGIIGTGAYLPRDVRDNEVLASVVGCDAEWISNKTGVHERRVASAEEATSDLAAEAARRALAAAGLDVGAVGLIVVATSTPDWTQPATACAVQQKLGASGAAFDLNAVCSGFVYALSVVQAAMRGDDTISHAVVIGADTYSRILDYSDRKTSVLFGDGAGAVVVSRVPDNYGVLSSYLTSDGALTGLVKVPAGGSRQPATQDTVLGGEHYFKMDGRGVVDFLYKAVPDGIEIPLKNAGLSVGDVDVLIPHQANGQLLPQLFDSLGVDSEKVHYTVDRYGNTGAASVAVTLDDAVRSGRIRSDDVIQLIAFGGGMTLGSTVMRWWSPDGRSR